MLLAAAIVSMSVAAAEPHPSHKKVGRALLTFYWLVDESASKYRGKRTSVLHDVHGKVIAETTRRFKVDLAMEGTGWLLDGRTVMFEKRVGGESRFRVTRAKYGLGSKGCALIPYRTVAVDSRFVKIGSTIYVPQLKGTQLPDGTVHDGIFVTTDHGHFRGQHIDVFVGAGYHSARPFIRKGYGSRSHVTVYLTDEKSPYACQK